jgi:hypothetical protein
MSRRNESRIQLLLTLYKKKFSEEFIVHYSQKILYLYGKVNMNYKLIIVIYVHSFHELAL